MKNTEEKMQQLQMIEQNMQQTLSQKQQFQMQLMEIDSALKEIKDRKSIQNSWQHNGLIFKRGPRKGFNI